MPSFSGTTRGVYPKVIVDETTSSTITYFGFALPGTATSSATWRVFRLTISTGVFEDADGNANYDNVWDNRASLTYS